MPASLVLVRTGFVEALIRRSVRWSIHASVQIVRSCVTI
jgi:hypothetical protein